MTVRALERARHELKKTSTLLIEGTAWTIEGTPESLTEESFQTYSERRVVDWLVIVTYVGAAQVSIEFSSCRKLRQFGGVPIDR